LLLDWVRRCEQYLIPAGTAPEEPPSIPGDGELVEDAGGLQILESRHCFVVEQQRVARRQGFIEAAAPGGVQILGGQQAFDEEAIASPVECGCGSFSEHALLERDGSISQTAGRSG
jgi:hypothetical protein